MRGRKPKSAYLKLIQGNPGQRPVVPEIQPSRGNLPDPPDFLGPDAVTEWNRVRSELYHLGMLTSVDINAFAAYCNSYARWLAAERALVRMAAHDQLTEGLMIKNQAGNAVKNPLVNVANRAASDMVKYASEFGLTPVARSRLAVGTFNQAKSKFDGLIGGGNPA